MDEVVVFGSSLLLYSLVFIKFLITKLYYTSLPREHHFVSYTILLFLLSAVGFIVTSVILFSLTSIESYITLTFSLELYNNNSELFVGGSVVTFHFIFLYLSTYVLLDFR